MNDNIKMLLSEIENNLKLLYEYPFEEVRGVYAILNDMVCDYSTENTKRFSDGEEKRGEEQLENHLQEFGSSQKI